MRGHENDCLGMCGPSRCGGSNGQRSCLCVECLRDRINPLVTTNERQRQRVVLVFRT